MSRFGLSHTSLNCLRGYLGLAILTAAWGPCLCVTTAASAAEGMEKQAEPPNPAQVEIDGYRTRIANGEAAKVLEECSKAIGADPKGSFTAYVGRGMAYNATKEFDKALEDFKLAIQIEGREPTALVIRSYAYTGRSETQYEKGEYLKAVDSAYFALLEKGDNPQAHLRRAMGYLGWDRPDKAINSANRALELDPKLAEAISVRGMAYGIKKDYARDIEDQTKALELAKDSSVILERRGYAYLLKGELDKAAKDITDALAKDPANSEALCDRAIGYAIAGRMSEAMADLDLAIKKNPSSLRAHYQKAMALQHQKFPDEALTSADDALRLNPRFVPALLLRASLLSDKKDFAKAIEDYTTAISADPKSIEAYTGRSQAYRKAGQLELAKTDTTKLKELQAAKAPAKKDKKEKEEEIPTFKVASRGVDPKRRPQVQEASRKIDDFVASNYEKYKIQPNPLTTDAQFVRRIYLDIAGTIPTYQQTLKFLNSKDPDKRANLIDELLGSEGYASNAFNYWADVLRYTDHVNGDVRGEPYRQWIKQSLAENKPWDKMVEEMLTAEGLIWQNPATGYLQRDANMPLDNMNNTVRIFLGTRIGCAQCHNHPFDRWTQKEFYQMAAFTFGTATRTGGNDKRYWKENPSPRLDEEYAALEQEEEDRRNNSYAFDESIRINMMIVNNQSSKQIHLPKDYAYDDAKPDSVVAPQTLFGSKAEIRAGETSQQAFARWLTEKENPRFAKTIANRLWQRTFGLGQIEPVDDMTDHTVAENPPLMDFLEAEMKDLNFDMKEFLRILYNSQTYQRQACFEEVPVGAPYHFPGPALRRMSAEQVWDSFLTLALENPEDYREIPASLRSDVIGFDLTTVTAQEVMDARSKRGEVDRLQNRWQDKHKYKGVLLARASELPSPLPANHFIRMFGQSDRELISASSTTGSVPQVLFMFNGPISHMLLEKNSTIYNNVMKKKTVTDGVKVVFLTVLNREPDAEDLALAAQEIKMNGPPGYGNVIWALVNTREFLFIQ